MTDELTLVEVFARAHALLGQAQRGLRSWDRMRAVRVAAMSSAEGP